jgi:3-oxoacyl-[acyl-carrier-protein] synthase III
MFVADISYQLGEKKISISDLFNNADLINKTGIEHVYETNGTTRQLAIAAARGLDESEFENVNLVILVTQSPDDFLPANSVQIAADLGVNPSALVFDINQGCSGFVQAFILAEKLLVTYRKILIVTADRYRSKLLPADRSTSAVFSDGASAVLLTDETKKGILFEEHFFDGHKRNWLFHSVSADENSGCLHMSGAEIWVFTRTVIVPQIQKALNFCEVNNLDVSGIYIHQASKLVVDGIVSMLGDYGPYVRKNFFKYGNTVSSTIPILMSEFPLDTSDNKVAVLAGFGVGLSSAVAVFG